MASGHVNRTQAEHMAAPTQACDVRKVLANSEPSTHGTKPTRQSCRSTCGGKADLSQQVPDNGDFMRQMPPVEPGRAAGGAPCPRRRVPCLFALENCLRLNHVVERQASSLISFCQGICPS